MLLLPETSHLPLEELDSHVWRHHWLWRRWSGAAALQPSSAGEQEQREAILQQRTRRWRQRQRRRSASDDDGIIAKVAVAEDDAPLAQ